MVEQLPIFQEIDACLEQKRRSEIAERAARAYPDGRNAVDIYNILIVVLGRLKEGIYFVHERYKRVAEHFTIEGDRRPEIIGQFDAVSAMYVHELDCIFIDYETLGMMCTGVLDRWKASIVPLEYWGNCHVAMEDLLFLIGVEEAHHACHMKAGGPHMVYRTEEEYRNDPAEQVAAKVVRQAVVDHNIQLYCDDSGK